MSSDIETCTDCGHAVDAHDLRAMDGCAGCSDCAPLRRHFHVHSSLGNGYLCECEEHPPLTAAERDAALRWERDSWRDYAAEDVAGQTHTVIRGSVRAGYFEVTDTLSRSWARYVTSWSCADPECYAAE